MKFRAITTIYPACLCCGLVPLACSTSESFGAEDTVGGAPPTEFDDRPVVRSTTPPPPIFGGTLLVTADDAYAVASDPDRDLVHIVDLATNQETATVALEPGAHPFRGAQDGAGLVHVTLRGTGQTVAIDPQSGQIVSTTSVCPNPRGIAFDAASNAMLVACAGGQLVRTDADTGAVVQRTFVAPDLRDVFVRDQTVFVTRFRSAQVLAVDADGTATLQGAPLSVMLDTHLRAPSTAWRTLPTEHGGWLMLHQLANSAPLAADPPRAGNDPGTDTDGGPQDTSGDGNGNGDGNGDGNADGYGGGPFAAPCGGAVQPALSALRPDGVVVSGGALQNIALAVDVALAPDGRSIVAASPSQHEAGESSDAVGVSLIRLDIRDFDDAEFGRCLPAVEIGPVDDFVAVAFDSHGHLLAQARERPQLYRFEGQAVVATIDLAGDDVTDTGHDLFHLDAGHGLSCASCHPEGGDDGRVWSFVDQGPRRTQPLNVGLAGTEPFHWRGEMDDMHVLAQEVRARRMGGPLQADARIDALRDWIFSIPRPNALRPTSEALVAHGQRVFGQLACDGCHSGPNLTSNGFSDFGQGALQIPNLHGVALHAPYMHDGRAADLTAATRDMIDHTPGAPPVSDDDVAAMVAYLESL